MADMSGNIRGLLQSGRGQLLEFMPIPSITGLAETMVAFANADGGTIFIGLGVDAPTPSWGTLISEGVRALRSYPNQVLFPSIALSITMFAFNFLGDGLRDALDPRMRGTT